MKENLGSPNEAFKGAGLAGSRLLHHSLYPDSSDCLWKLLFGFLISKPGALIAKIAKDKYFKSFFFFFLPWLWQLEFKMENKLNMKFLPIPLYGNTKLG